MDTTAILKTESFQSQIPNPTIADLANEANIINEQARLSQFINATMSSMIDLASALPPPDCDVIMEFLTSKIAFNMIEEFGILRINIEDYHVKLKQLENLLEAAKSKLEEINHKNNERCWLWFHKNFLWFDTTIMPEIPKMLDQLKKDIAAMDEKWNELAREQDQFILWFRKHSPIKFMVPDFVRPTITEIIQNSLRNPSTAAHHELYDATAALAKKAKDYYEVWNAWLKEDTYLGGLSALKMVVGYTSLRIFLNVHDLDPMWIERRYPLYKHISSD